MTPRLPLREFLTHAKSTLHNGIKRGTSRSQPSSPPRLTFVIGNESADLDSITSSLVYAYLRSQTHPPEPPFEPIIIPLANLPRADISLRPELSALLLNHTDVKTEDLITLDDLSTEGAKLDEVLPVASTHWILVDHNALTGTLGSIYKDSVVGVIDHHKDEGAVREDCGDEPRIVDTSGSCASLVVNYLSDAWTSLSQTSASSSSSAADAKKSETVDSQLAKLAMAAILIDTTNMTVSSKVTFHDEQAVRYLRQKLPSDFDQEAFFTQISHAKESIEHLSVGDVLRKDYKEWQVGDMKLGVACVVKPLRFLVEKTRSKSDQDEDTGPFLEALRAFVKTRSLDVVAVMTTYTPSGGQFSRELLVWPVVDRAEEAVRVFGEKGAKEFDLTALSDGSIKFADERVHAWQQGAVEHSRKKVAPLLREAMSRS